MGEAGRVGSGMEVVVETNLAIASANERIRGDTLTSGRAPGLVNFFHLPLARLGPKPTAGELLSSNPESLGLSEESLRCRLGCRVRPACGKTFASTSGGLLVHLAGPRRNLDYWDYQMSAPFFL